MIVLKYQDSTTEKSLKTVVYTIFVFFFFGGGGGQIFKKKRFVGGPLLKFFLKTVHLFIKDYNLVKKVKFLKIWVEREKEEFLIL